MSPDYIFNVVYLLLSICVIYPPTEFTSAGLTIPSIFSKFLGNEHEKFVNYHMKKSCLYLFVYSLLPLGYIILSSFLGYTVEMTELFTSYSLFWRIFTTSSLVFPCLSLYQISNWIRNDYEKHPIAKNLSKFNNNYIDWRMAANDINLQFRRVDKICIQTSAIVRIVVTDNWILKITPITMFAIHQNDASLIVKEADTYHISTHNSLAAQYLNIEVKSDREGIEPFIIRIHSGDFKDLMDRVSRRIAIMPNVKFHQSVVDQFTDVFKETIKINPLYECNQELDQCIGCLQTNPSIKIQKLCEDIAGQPNCTNCHCKPMWCTDCMAKWFASRQEVDQQSRWLSSKCTCPMCRATFCMLDICLLSELNNEE